MALTRATGKQVTVKSDATGGVVRSLHDKLSETVSVKDFGAVGDGVTDDTAAIQAALDNCVTSSLKLYVPKGTYNFSSALTMGNHSIVMDGTFNYVGSSAITCLTIAADKREIEVDIRAATVDWSNDALIGVHITGQSNTIKIKRCYGFAIGARFGVTAPFAYNTLINPTIQQCRIGMYLLNTDVNSYVNQNNIVGGTIGVFTDATLNTYNRYGVRVGSSSGTYLNNNNVFYNLSIELKAGLTSAEASAILMERGRANVFNNCRCEDATTSGIGAVIEKYDSYSNQYNFAWCDAASRFITYRDSDFNDSVFTENLYSSTKGVMSYKVFSSGSVVDIAHPYSATATCIDGMHVQSSAQPNPQLALTGVTINSDNVQFPLSVGFGTFVSTENAKQFTVDLKAASSQGGRVWVQCFNSSGTRLTSSDAGHPYVVGTATQGFGYSTSYGGAYRNNADETDFVKFSVTNDEVAYVNIVVSGGSGGSILLQQFDIYAEDMCRTWLSNQSMRYRDRLGSAAPTTGTWSQGAVVWDFTPSSSSKMGWVCVSAGTPGTWKAFGAIDS